MLYLRDHCQIQCQEAFLLCFVLRVLQFALICRSFIHFELFFCRWYKIRSNFILLHVEIQFSQHHGLKPLSFSPYMVWVPLSKIIWGLPCWHSGWESACQCRGHGFEPLSGKIPHATEQLGPWATITEPACLEPVLRNRRGHDGERPVHHDKEWPPLAATRESPRTETKTQHRHK